MPISRFPDNRLKNQLRKAWSKRTTSGTNVTVNWGNIAGTLSNQTDLQAALDAKADVSGIPDIEPVTGLTIPISGLYLDAAKSSNALTGVLPGIADIFELLPFVPARDVTISAIGVNVTTAVGGATMKVGIYSSGADGLPDALIVESTDLDCSSTGFKSFATSQTLNEGEVYWLFSRCSSTASVTGLIPSTLTPINRTTATGVANCSIRKTLAYATAATDPFGAVVAGDMYNNSAYAVFLVVA